MWTTCAPSPRQPFVQPTPLICRPLTGAIDSSRPHGYVSNGGKILLKIPIPIDIAVCFQCGGPVTHIASIEDPNVMVKILAHLGLPTKAPPRFPGQAGPLFQTA